MKKSKTLRELYDEVFVALKERAHAKYVIHIHKGNVGEIGGRRLLRQADRKLRRLGRQINRAMKRQ